MYAGEQERGPAKDHQDSTNGCDRPEPFGAPEAEGVNGTGKQQNPANPEQGSGPQTVAGTQHQSKQSHRVNQMVMDRGAPGLPVPTCFQSLA